MGIEIKCYTSPNDLLCLEREWTDLLQKSFADPFFMSFPRIVSWLKFFGRRGKILVYAVYSENDILAIFPLILSHEKGLRILKIMGSGYSDYLDFLIDPCFTDLCIRIFIEEILSEVQAWDIFHCRHFLSGSPTEQAFRTYFSNSSSYLFFQGDFSVGPYVRIENSWPVYCENNIKKRILQDTRRQINRISRDLGPLIYRRISDLNEFDFFEKLISFHKIRREQRKGDYSIFQEEVFIEFIKDVSAKFFQENRTHCSILLAGEEAIALHLGFLAHGVFYYLFPVINDAYAKYSPGRILLFKLLEECFANGFEFFDFGYGSEDYKFDITKTHKKLMENIIAKNTTKGRLALLWHSKYKTMFNRNTFIMHNLYYRLKRARLV